MSAFRAYELEAVRLMAGEALTSDQLRSLENDAELVSYEYTGSGYFLTVRHLSLPVERKTLSEPAVVGNVGEIQAGFVAFLGEQRLTLECHTWGAVDVPEDFRELAVIISTPPVNILGNPGPPIKRMETDA